MRTQIKRSFVLNKRTLSLHLNGKPLILMDQFTYLGSNISSTESNVNIRIGKVRVYYWEVIDHTEIRSPEWKKTEIFSKLSVLLYGYTTRILTKLLEKKLCENYANPTAAVRSLVSHLTNHVSWTTHVSHVWKNWEELIDDLLLWTPSYGHSNVGLVAKTYDHQLCADTKCSEFEHQSHYQQRLICH